MISKLLKLPKTAVHEIMTENLGKIVYAKLVPKVLTDKRRHTYKDVLETHCVCDVPNNSGFATAIYRQSDSTTRKSIVVNLPTNLYSTRNLCSLVVGC